MNVDNETQNSSPGKRVKPKVGTDSLRVKRETKKKVLAELASLNKKGFGKAVTPDDYVSLAITLLRPEHLEQLKDRSLTNKDRLELRYQQYCEVHGKVSKDEFLGALLEGRVKEG